MIQRVFLCLVVGIATIVSLHSQPIDSLERVLAQTSEPGAMLLVELSDAWRMQDRDKSLQYAEQALDIATQTNFQSELNAAHLELARALEGKGNYAPALEHAREALKFSEDSLNASDIYHLIGLIYEGQSQLEQSLNYHMRAIRIRQNAGDISRVINSRNSLAFVYRAMGKYEDAIKILRDNLATAKEIDDQQSMDRSRFNIGLMKLELNKHAEAIPWFKEAVKNQNEANHPGLFSSYYNNLANCYEKLLHINADYYDSALYYGHKSLVIKQAMNNTRGIANAHNMLAATYERASDYEQSFFHATKALAISDSLGFKPIKLNALNYLITAELGLGKTENTNEHFIAYGNLQSDLFNEANSQRLTELAAKYEAERKEAENRSLRMESKEKQMTIVILGAFAVVLLIFIGLLYYIVRTKQQLNAQLAIDKEIIGEQSKALKELNILKSNFFATISHELRTPLTLIQGHAEEVMRTKRLPGSTAEPLRKIKRNIHQLAVMVNDLLDLSKFELQERKVDLRPTDINSSLKRLCAAFTSLAESKNLNFKYFSNELGVVAALLDEDQFEKVINNLIYNAFKFCRTKDSITISLFRVFDGIQVEISDTGIGIPEEELPYIFDRFYQPKSEIPQSFGAGMGLSIAKDFVELMGGSISVESGVVKGTTFKLIFNPTDEIPDIQSSDNSVIDHSETLVDQDLLEIPSDITVMVVEDNSDVRDYLTRVLRDHFTLILAANGVEALEELDKKLPDLILTDVMMPQMNGWELLEQLQQKPKLARIPVIVLTAIADSEERVKGLRMGVDDYLLKPFESEELLIRISNVVNNLRERIKWAKEFQEERPKKDLSEEHDLLLRLKNYVMEHIDDKHLNVAQIAMFLGLSERQLYRKTSEIVGLSPSKLIQEVKLQYARELLLSQRFNKLAQIAGAIGFDSTQHFSKLYTERFGKKPSDYFS